MYPIPYLQTVGDVLGVVENAFGVTVWDAITLPDLGNVGIPHVGSLPPATSTSLDVLFLTHEHTRGARRDATLTIGFSEGGLAGFSSERPAYGSINKLSPLIRIYGAGDASGYSLQDFVSYSDDWLNEFTHVTIARVEYALGTSTPEHGRFFRRGRKLPCKPNGGVPTAQLQAGRWKLLLHRRGGGQRCGGPICKA